MSRSDYPGRHDTDEKALCEDCETQHWATDILACDCGIELCVVCHEDRICCGENAPADCPECGDAPVVAEHDDQRRHTVRCMNVSDGCPRTLAVMYQDRQWRAIDKWNELAAEHEAGEVATDGAAAMAALLRFAAGTGWGCASGHRRQKASPLGFITGTSDTRRWDACSLMVGECRICRSTICRPMDVATEVAA